MMTFFKQMLTEVDNRTFDLFRIMALLSILTGLCLMVYAVGWLHQTFNMGEFGAGVGVLFVGAGAALKLKPEAPTGSSTVIETSITETTKEKP
jgi:hypothetical protein